MLRARFHENRYYERIQQLSQFKVKNYSLALTFLASVKVNIFFIVCFKLDFVPYETLNVYNTTIPYYYVLIFDIQMKIWTT